MRADITCTVVIPTLNASSLARHQMEVLRSQTVVPDVVVVDSSSSDGTAAIYAQNGAKVVAIDRKDFHHATTRNLGASMATGQYVAFLTQDAVPANSQWLEKLLTPLVAGTASASYSRQLPSVDAKPTERYARYTNYPVESRTFSTSDLFAAGIRAQFFSNSASAVRLEAFKDIGAFPTGTVQNEDMLLASRLLKGGHSIAYVADSEVIHSHDLTLMQVLKRYFDIGTVFTDAGADLVSTGMSRQGAIYFVGLVRHLHQNGELQDLLFAVAETTAKVLGTVLGRKYRLLPHGLVEVLSNHPDYWKRRSRDTNGL